MKKKKKKDFVSSQKEANKIFEESKEKQKNPEKTDKTKSRKKSSMKTSKKIIIVLAIIVLLVIGGGSIYYINLVLIKDQIVLESGTSTKGLEQKFIEKRGNLEIKKIEYTNTNKNVKNKKELATVEVYLDSKGNEVEKEKACTKKGTEKKSKYILKKGYTKDTRLIDVYKYDVKIIAKDGRVFKSKLVLKDTKAPKLIAKESVEVTEGDEIKADMFLERYEDASNRAHGDMYFVKEVKEKANSNKDTKKKKNIEKYELTDEDKKVGEHELLVVVEDPSRHASEPVKVKLIVKEKSQEPTEEIETNGDSSDGSHGRSGGNSGGNTGGSACGSQGYARMTPTSGMMISQSMLYAFWGCDGSDASFRPSVQAANIELGLGAGRIELDACNARHGYCQDSSIPETVYDVATGKSVGMYAPFYMHIGDWVQVGEGYILPGRIVMTFRNY